MLFMGYFECDSLVDMKLSSSLQGRREAGAWLKGLREDAGLTQVALARRLGFKYYAFISQVETGFSRVPTEKLEVWARTLDVEPADFTRRLILFYEPELHRLLYETKSRRSRRRKRSATHPQRREGQDQ
jgi:transcriptional regulator with XRE-family HTH domain